MTNPNNRGSNSPSAPNNNSPSAPKNKNADFAMSKAIAELEQLKIEKGQSNHEKIPPTTPRATEAEKPVVASASFLNEAETAVVASASS